MVWHGWGDPAERRGLDPRALKLLGREIGALDRRTPPVPLEEVRVRPSQLPPAERQRFEAVLGPDGVRDDHRTRVEHAGGKSYPDLYRRRSGDAEDAPDAVLYPADARAIDLVLEIAGELEVAVVPFGGGTSVVGGVEPLRGGFHAVVAVDTSPLRAVERIDRRSLVATIQPGARGPHAEAQLRADGVTLGHFPQSYAWATIGGYVATRSSGQASTGYGRIDELVEAVEVATPVGRVSAGSGAPASAAGPDLRQLLVGSEGTLGIITAVDLRVAPLPDVEAHEAWAAPSFADGAEALRALVQAGAAPDICRLSDAHETRVALEQVEGVKGTAFRGLLRLRGFREPCLVILGWEGSERAVAARRKEAARVLKGTALGGLGEQPGAAWARGRFAGPYLRDELMDRGVMVETLETAASWSDLGTVYGEVSDALVRSLTELGTAPLVLCHVSHVYRTGASLYFTFVAQQLEGRELEQWRTAKTAASDAIMRAGGTITHHHAIGTDHKPWMAAEVGELGVEVLRAVKARLDPKGIMNPGKLLP